MVVNIRTDKYDVYIGRPSVFGNPFPIVDGDRDGCIEKYKEYFEKRIVEDTEFRERVLGLKGKVLGCFCKPLACHGGVIEEYLKKKELKRKLTKQCCRAENDRANAPMSSRNQPTTGDPLTKF